MAYNQQVAQQQALLNQQNFGITPGYQALAVDGRLGPLTQSALAQYGTPQSLTMVNGAPVIPTNALNQNGAMPNMPSVNPNMTPQQFVAGLTPLTPVQTQSASPISVSGNTANVNALEKGQSSLVKRLGAAQQQLLGQGQEQLALEQQAGIPQSVKDIAALTDQINAKQAAFNNTEEIYRNGAISSQAIATGRVQRLQQAAAVELGGLSAMLLGKQGNMEAAKAQVDRTLKLEFDPIKQEIENTKTFLELNYKDLDRADKKQADALRVQLAREDRAAQYAQQNRQTASNMALELYKAGSLTQEGFANILNGNGNLADALKSTSVNAATLGSDPLTSLQSIIKTSGAKTDDKLKLTGSALSVLQKFAENNSTGSFAGLGPIRAGSLTVGPKGQNNRTYLSGLAGTVESWMTGASVSDIQQERIRKDLIPKESDTSWQIQNKINGLTNYMLDYASGNLITQGINYKPVTVDLWTIKSDPLNLDLGTGTQNATNPLGLSLQ